MRASALHSHMLGWPLFFTRPGGSGRMGGLEFASIQCAYRLFPTPAHCPLDMDPQQTQAAVHIGLIFIQHLAFPPCPLPSPSAARRLESFSLRVCSCRCHAGFVETARTRHLRISPRLSRPALGSCFPPPGHQLVLWASRVFPSAWMLELHLRSGFISAVHSQHEDLLPAPASAPAFPATSSCFAATRARLHA